MTEIFAEFTKKSKINNKTQSSQNFKDAIDINVNRGSSKVIKYLTQSVIIAIAYLLNIVPDNDYYRKCCGLKTRLSLEIDDDAIPSSLNKSIQNAFKIFDRKYLQKLVVYFYQDDRRTIENLVLFTVFEYTYFTNSKTRNLISDSFKEIQEKHQKFLLSCVALADYFPCLRCNDCLVDFELYLNREAPETYNPVGYIGTFEKDHNTLTILREQFQVVAHNKLGTNFHGITTTVYAKELSKVAE